MPRLLRPISGVRVEHLGCVPGQGGTDLAHLGGPAVPQVLVSDRVDTHASVVAVEDVHRLAFVVLVAPDHEPRLELRADHTDPAERVPGEVPDEPVLADGQTLGADLHTSKGATG